MSPNPMADVRITPDPSDEEVAAILAAVEGAWPRAGAPVPTEAAARWRWSGRWWTKPIARRRNRPY